MPRKTNLIPPVVGTGALGLVLLLGACTGVRGLQGQGSATPPATEAHLPGTSGAAPSASASAAVGPSPSAITRSQAIDAVKAFAPDAHGLEVTEIDDAAMGPAYRVSSADVMAAVDKATGRVTMFLDNAAMPSTASVKISRDEALGKAMAWLAEHAVTTSGLTARATLLDHGETKEYQVVLEGRVGGARIPHRIDVSVDPATGTVYGFVLYDRAYTPPPTPRLTPDDAATAARAEESDPGARVTASDLAIAFDPSGRQLLVYELDLTRTDGFYVKVQVDALSGAVTVLGRG